MKQLLIITIAFIPLFGFSQTSPGGVSNNLRLWLKADLGPNCSTNGCSVTTWSDQSGNSNNAVRTGGTANLNLGNTNYNPVIDAEDLNRNFSTSSFTGQTIVYAGRANISSSNNYSGYLGFDSDKGFREHLNASNTFRNQGGNVNDGDWTINSTFYYDGLGNNTSNISNIEIFHIGAGSRTSNTTNAFYLGGYYNGRYYNQTTLYGDVIVYSDVLTATELRKVESYLAIKYGVTLDNTGSGTSGDYISSAGTTIWDASNNPSYHNDVIGIARDDFSALYQRQSHQIDDSTRMYLSTLSTMNSSNSGTFSSDEHFLLMGNNSDPLKSEGSTEYPPSLGVFSRLEREWKITNTAFSGTFSLDITLNTSPLTASDLRILVDDNGNFVDATLYNPSITVSGNTLTISGLSTTEIPANTTRYLTLVSINSTTPLPIELVNFNTTLIDHNFIKLDWQTVSEINNDYFTIERSRNIVNWQEVNKINGSGNSSSLLTYKSIDHIPYMGISYYRLKQTDFDGQFSYSHIKSVNIRSEGDSRIEIFPNPTESQITIAGNEYELDYVRIYNTLGQDVTMFTYQINSSKSKLIVDLSELSKGMYYIKTKTTANKVYKQ
jgi:hypothetical protein